MTYYILNKNTRELIRQSKTPFNVDESVQPPDPYIQLKRVDDNTVPNHNPDTHKTVREFIDDDLAFTRTYRYVIVPLTQDEIDQRAQEQQDAQQLETIRQAYNDLRNGTGTATERLQRCERALAWLLREHVRNDT